MSMRMCDGCIFLEQVMLPVIFGLSGSVLTPDERVFFAAANPAGYILFARNIDTPNQLRSLTDALRGLSGRDNLPILIDQEGGRIARMGPPHWRAWPAAITLSEAAGYRLSASERVRCNYEALGLELASMGVTVTCAPVLDVPQADAHDIIGDRAFGARADIVSQLGRACLRGLHLAGIEGVIKHIPGHGRARSDSHETLPHVDASAADLVSDSQPFVDLCDAAMAMTAHVVYEAWDPHQCASVSSQIIEQQIRGRIGFEGLLISDDLDMKALSGTLAERAAAVLQAGCDIALNCWGRLDDMEAIANRVAPMPQQSVLRLTRACAHLDVMADTPALRARIETLLAYRDAR
jgi:beta-N-acetylhexosaminidase